MFLIVFHELTTTDQILSLKIEKKERRIVSAAKYQSIPTFELLLPKGESKAFKLYQNLVCVCVCVFKKLPRQSKGKPNLLPHGDVTILIKSRVSLAGALV